MIQTTTWYPDTCDCIIQYQWDDKIVEDKRTHNVYNILSTCKFHQGKPDQVFSTVLAENQVKNKAVGIVADQIQDIKTEDISFEFDDSRKLTLSVAVDIDPDLQKQIQSNLDILDIVIEKK